MVTAVVVPSDAGRCTQGHSLTTKTNITFVVNSSPRRRRMNRHALLSIQFHERACELPCASCKALLPNNKAAHTHIDTCTHLGLVNVLKAWTHLHGGVDRREVEFAIPDHAKREVGRRSHPSMDGSAPPPTPPMYGGFHGIAIDERQQWRLVVRFIFTCHLSWPHLLCTVLLSLLGVSCLDRTTTRSFLSDIISHVASGLTFSSERGLQLELL